MNGDFEEREWKRHTLLFLPDWTGFNAPLKSGIEMQGQCGGDAALAVQSRCAPNKRIGQQK